MTEERRWIRGVPQPLPAGESLLWEGAPGWAGLLRHALHVRLISTYFTLIILAGLVGAVRDRLPLPQLLVTALTQSLLGLLVVGLLYTYARLSSRQTVYAITDRRVVMKIGLVLPTTINIPFRLIDSAASHVFPDGTGQIALQLRARDRIAFIHLWPHVRPWRLRQPEPMLRGLENPAAVAEMIRRAALASNDPLVEPDSRSMPASASTPGRRVPVALASGGEAVAR
jgi:hypothetical protein